MATIVQKYGGSSLADVSCLKGVARSIVTRRRAGFDMVVVVSAMGKTTDQLIEQACSVSASPPRRELDMLVTAGERISMALLSMAIQEEGEDAISFTGSQCGIITEDSHQGARIIEVRPYRIHEELERGRVVIVAGYQGVSLRREVTTLGRGGSDTTAVALAAALRAEACEIYSDVDGVYSADPNICPQATLLREVPYEVMQAMAGAGAKVLNADAVEFARRAGIEILARKTADSSGRQSSINARAPIPPGVCAVVAASAVTRIRGEGSGLSELLSEVRGCGGRVLAARQGVSGLDLLVDRTGIPGKDPLPLDEIARRTGLASERVGVATLIGAGLAGRADVLSRSRAALEDQRIRSQLWLASDTAVFLTMSPDAPERAAPLLHQALVSGA